MPPRSEIWSIQYLRAIAAIGVVVFHQLQTASALFTYGAYGVDLFFVISGFIMQSIIDRRPTTPRLFITDRLARVAPLYWVATLFCFGVVAAGIYLHEGSADPILLIRSLLFIPTARADGQIYPTLFLGWTLNYEMFFYVLFAACLWCGSKFRLPVFSAVILFLVALGGLSPEGGAVWATYTNPLLLEFLAGAWLAKAFRPEATDRHALAATLLVGAVLALAAIWLPRMIYGAAAALFVGGGLLIERTGNLPRLPWLKALGDASYSIYLFQQFAFAAVLIVFAKTGLSAPLALSAASIAAAITLGLASRRWLETPLYAAARRGLRAEKPT